VPAGGDERLQSHNHGITDPTHTHTGGRDGSAAGTGPGWGAGPTGLYYVTQLQLEHLEQALQLIVVVQVTPETYRLLSICNYVSLKPNGNQRLLRCRTVVSYRQIRITYTVDNRPLQDIITNSELSGGYI
jgi:hypothetical protein